jgi:hypothetical protein
MQLHLHCLFLQCLHLSVCTYSVYKHVVPTSQIDIRHKIPLTSSSQTMIAHKLPWNFDLRGSLYTHTASGVHLVVRAAGASVGYLVQYVLYCSISNMEVVLYILSLYLPVVYTTFLLYILPSLYYYRETTIYREVPLTLPLLPICLYLSPTCWTFCRYLTFLNSLVSISASISSI